jgi:hypothetical protein
VRTTITCSIAFISHCHSGELVNQDNPRLDWKKWAKGMPDSSGVVLHGWPLEEPPTALLHIRNKDTMQTILDAIICNDCYFD